MQADDGNVGVIVDPWGDHVILKKWDRIELNLTDTKKVCQVARNGAFSLHGHLLLAIMRIHGTMRQ